MMAEKRLIGIDFGTTNSCVCHTRFNPQIEAYDDPRPIEFDNRPVLRSVLLLDERGSHALAWGEMVYRAADYVTHPERAREEFKLNIGVDPEAGRLVTLLFQRAREAMLRHLNVTELAADENQVVVGVPAQWSPERSAATCQALEAAGFPTVEAVAEPVGAMYYHYYLGDLRYTREQECTLVIDFGGGTTDFVLVRSSEGDPQPQILHTYGERYGGRDFDQAMLRYILRRYWCGEAPDEGEQLELLRFARQFKEFFSDCANRQLLEAKRYCGVPGVDTQVILTIADFEDAQVCGLLIDRFAGIILKGLRGSGLSPRDVDRVILTGGSARWYFVRQAVESMFACPIFMSANPEQTIAKGLALARGEFRARRAAAIAAVPARVPAAPSAAQTILPKILPGLTPLGPMSQEELLLRRAQTRRTITKYAGMAGGTAILLSPIIGSSLALSGIEAKMMMDISRIYGYNLSPQEVGTIIGGLLAGGAVLKMAVSEALTFVPGIGWVAKGGVAVVVVKGLGELAIKYFEKSRQGATNLAPSGLEEIGNNGDAQAIES
jgi:uncharacterized protein (DUF697 family)/actin-like ATPase involved in cell morphogenesis